MKKVSFWGQKKRCFLVKKGSDFVFLGGGLKTWSLKVDRIYGEIFSEVSTLVGSFFVFLGSFFRVFGPLFWGKNDQIHHFLTLFSLFSSFSTFSEILEIFMTPPSWQNTDSQTLPPINVKLTKLTPQKWPGFGVKVSEILGRKKLSFLSYKMLRFLSSNVKIPKFLMPQLIPKFLSVNVTVCLYAPTSKRTAQFEGENERRRWRKWWRNERDRRETSGLFNAGLTPCSHTTTTKEW